MERMQIFALEGELTQEKEPELQNILREAAWQQNHITFDFAGVHYIGTACIGALVSWMGCFDSLSLLNCNPTVKKVLDTLGLSKFFILA